MKRLISSKILFSFRLSRRKLFSSTFLVYSFPLTACDRFLVLLRRRKNGREKRLKKNFSISVNDSFVMNKWSKTYINNRKIKFLVDGSAKYTYALGLELDLLEKGMGIRY